MRRVKYGDTLIEVVFSFTIFATVSVASISIMNSGLNQAQRSLEVTMARNEIDAQAETLRFLQNNFSAERELEESAKQFTGIWDKITGQKALNASEMSRTGMDINSSNFTNCNDVYTAQVHAPDSKVFVLNTRLIQPKTVVGNAGGFTEKYAELLDMMVIPQNKTNTVDRAKIMRPSTLYPRLTYTSLAFSADLNDEGMLDRDTTNEDTLVESRMFREAYSAEGIWVISVKGQQSSYNGNRPQYYDFYIRTCWQSVGTKAPSTLSTIIRLYNPEVIE